MIPRADILELVASLTGYQSEWEGLPQEFVAPIDGKPGGVLRVRVAAIRPVGSDELTREFDPDTRTTRDTWNTQRVVTFSVKCEIHDPEVLAVDVLETLRLRLQRESTRALLAESGLAIIKFESVVAPATEVVIDNRTVDFATLDFHANQIVHDLDESSDGGIIETVNTTNEVPGDVTT